MSHTTQLGSAAAPAKTITLTEKALARVRAVLSQQGLTAEGGIRLGVQGGGCSGLSYVVQFETGPQERDRIFTFGDVRVFVDPKSFIYLAGMTVDYEETLMKTGFVFNNPNAAKSCGCGSSFTA
ncbi:MAG TPA: iron-sulfur cluster assembly accessory protein [Terriglobales bacterium]|nr:iron-sulfur cluster assembly accessory protein [Terriglobales bacterium]